MPTYDYVCADCKHTFTEITTIADRDKMVCPACGSTRTERDRMAAPAVISGRSNSSTPPRIPKPAGFNSAELPYVAYDGSLMSADGTKKILDSDGSPST